MLRCAVYFTFVLTALPLGAQEESVRPGINKSFEKPDVPLFVERFEREGRDVYDRRNEIVAAMELKPGIDTNLVMVEQAGYSGGRWPDASSLMIRNGSQKRLPFADRR